MKKPGTKDLPPKSPARVKGGTANMNDNVTLVRGAKAKKRDLPPRKTVKGGMLAANDNITIVKSPKPAPPKDLEPRKPIKGGFKQY
jgi:hypothetical protein